MMVAFTLQRSSATRARHSQAFEQAADSGLSLPTQSMKAMPRMQISQPEPSFHLIGVPQDRALMGQLCLIFAN
jgi:hypothetical protein